MIGMLKQLNFYLQKLYLKIVLGFLSLCEHNVLLECYTLIHSSLVSFLDFLVTYLDLASIEFSKV